jgi:hypothetical protein
VLFASIVISFVQTYIEGLDPLILLDPEWVWRYFRRNAVLLNNEWWRAYPVHKISRSTVYNSWDQLWPWRWQYTGKLNHYIFVTSNQFILVKSILGRSSIVSCALCIIIFYFVFCPVSATNTVDFRLLINRAPYRWWQEESADAVTRTYIFDRNPTEQRPYGGYQGQRRSHLSRTVPIYVVPLSV